MEEKTILQRIFEVANDTSSDGTTELIMTQDNMKEIVQEINEKYISKEHIRDKCAERKFELQQEYKEFDDDIKLNTLQDLLEEE